MSKVNNKDAGVNIDAGNDAVNRIKENVKSTFTKNVLTGIGSFGSLFSLKTILKEYITRYYLGIKSIQMMNS